MSDDSGRYCLKTKKGDGFEYRVASLQNIENLERDDNAIDPNNGKKGWYNSDPDNLIKNARYMFKDAEFFTDEQEAFKKTIEMADEGYCEYGAGMIEIDREF